MTYSNVAVNAEGFVWNELITEWMAAEWAGNLVAIRNPAKYVARLGQAFSQTEPGLEVNPQWIQRKPDVIAGQDPHGKPYCFSDGIGKISKSLMTKLQERVQRNGRGSRRDNVGIMLRDFHTPYFECTRFSLVGGLAQWHVGLSRRTFPVARSTFSWSWVTIYVCKPSAGGQPTIGQLSLLSSLVR